MLGLITQWLNLFILYRRLKFTSSAKCLALNDRAFNEFHQLLFTKI